MFIEHVIKFMNWPLLQSPVGALRPVVLQKKPDVQGWQPFTLVRPDTGEKVPAGQNSGSPDPSTAEKNKCSLGHHSFLLFIHPFWVPVPTQGWRVLEIIAIHHAECIREHSTQVNKKTETCRVIRKPVGNSGCPIHLTHSYSYFGISSLLNMHAKEECRHSATLETWHFSHRNNSKLFLTHIECILGVGKCT